jgi:RNA polymerase sigma-70 factor (ECF subfamily)
VPGLGKTRQTIWPAPVSPEPVPVDDEPTPRPEATDRADPADLHGLAQRAVAGDRSALQELFRALFPLVHKHLSFVLGFSPMVEDAVQESMLGIHRALPGFRGEASIATWALAIASRTAVRHARRERRHQVEELDRAIGESIYGHDSAAGGGELVLMIKALGSLTLKKRLAFVLFAILDCSATEAGEVLGTSPNTAASRYRHARQELLAQLERDAAH